MNLDKAITELGERAKQLRVDRGLKQEELANNAGVSVSTVKALESGKSISLLNLARILQQLDCLDGLVETIPEVAPNPIDLLKLEGKTRQRVR